LIYIYTIIKIDSINIFDNYEGYKMKTKTQAIMHPIRMRILLNLSSQSLTSRELSERLQDVSQATLYRHIKVLYEADLLQVIEERQVRNVTEKVYTLSPGSASLSPEDISTATADDHIRFFTVFVSSLLADFSRYLETEDVDFARDGVGYSQVPLNLTDEELTGFTQKLNHLILPLLGNELTEGRVRRAFSTILIPDDFNPPDN
jgi:DNA-binding transcriptional ArsR family regulator